MRKFIALLAISISLTACNEKKSGWDANQATDQNGKKYIYQDGNAEIYVTSGAKPKSWVDSSYAAYHLGNSIEVFNSKVYIVYLDTTMTVAVDSVTWKKVDTTLKTYFFPQIDTLFQDQAKRQKPVLDEATKKIKKGINWLPIDEKFILQDYKLK